ncbi:MAG: hypothetical protein JKY88_13645 [Pseudomonadales bacterium]|nr:hypothetical protein [Pseudomonadales bacterium]
MLRDNRTKPARSKPIAIIAAILAAFIMPTLPILSVYGDSIYPDSIESLQRSVLEHRNKGNLKVAVELQANIIEQLLEQKSEQNSALNTLYYNMGILQYESDNFLAAKLALEKSITLTKKTYGPLHESTLNGLTSLGLLLLREELLESAMESFSEAQYIMHRSYGVRSTKQEALLDWMSKIHLEQNHFEAADTLQKLNYETYKATYGSSDPRSVPALLKLGLWLQRSGQYTDSISRFKDAIHIIKSNELPSEVLHEALLGIAKTHYLKGKCCAGEYMAEAAHAITDNIKFDIIDKHKAFLHAADMSLFMQDEAIGNKAVRRSCRIWNQIGNT